MRPLALAVALLAPVLAGCLVPADLEAASATLDPAQVVAPQGAKVEAIESGARLVWDAVQLPFQKDFTVPEGTTLVRLTAKGGASDALGVALRNAESGRRRCQTPFVESWTSPIRGEKSCVALTAVDDLPASWEIQVTGPRSTARVTVDFLAVPLDGPAAKLDLSQLSKPVHALLDTEVVKVPSFDGTPLHVELTRPDTQEKVPAVIVSSPYNDATRAARLRPSDDLILDWGARGYAIVVADVRGYGESGGCVEVWSANEQKDQKALVEWVAAQAWSDGTVGFYGQSYVATTPVAAAVQAPEALKAIIAVAPVINAYDDWHFGGVPNGEGLLSPVAYQQIGTGTRAPPGPDFFLNRANGVCDPTLAVRANDPRAIYDAFYAERNFSTRAKDVKAAVLYTQGFEDSNVKSSMITHWFNALESPKLGLFGHWVHQHPPRGDQELLFLAWMDQHVKGKALGMERLAPAYVLDNRFGVREAEAWPPLDAEEARLYPDFKGGTLGHAPVDGFQLLMLRADTLPVAVPGKTTLVSLASTLDAPLQLAGSARVDVNAHMEVGENGYVAAFLYDGDDLVTYGMFNIGHRFGHDKHVSARYGEMLAFSIPLLPTEHAFEEGDELRLELRGARVTERSSLVRPGQPSEIGLHGGEAGMVLVLPTVPSTDATQAPAALRWD